ncbi:hypothetical protein GC170_14805 [bacterium]|nr:hypothetical protein [bacterium]
MAQVADEPWLMYRSMALDDLRLALGRAELKLETLRVEAARVKKLADAGAVAAVEVAETRAALAIAAAEREELVGLVRWMVYTKSLEDKNRVFDEEEHFRQLLGHLEPRVRLAETVSSLMRQRHALNERLIQRRAISNEEFERSGDALADAIARQKLYSAQAAAARLALEVRQGKREYQEAESLALAEAIRMARSNIWTTALVGVQHRLDRLEALRARGVVSQAEVDAVNETKKVYEQARDEAKSAAPEPIPPPGKLKRPQVQLVRGEWGNS